MSEYPQYLDFNDVPVRKGSPLSIPEIYRGNSRWEHYIDVARMRDNSQLVDAEKFQELIAAWDASLSNMR